MKYRNKEKFYIALIFGIVTLLNIYAAIHHTMWRDETQAWLIARDTYLRADSLFSVTSYEGHPFLWFVVLMPFAKLGFPAWTLKVLSLVFITVALALFLLKTEYSIGIKALVAISPIYLYSLVVPARSYSLAALLMTCIIVVYKDRNRKPLLYAIFLALLLQTLTIYGGFVFACGLMWFIETCIEIKNREVKVTEVINRILGMVLVFSSGVFLLWEFRYTNAVVNESECKPVEALFALFREGCSDLESLFGKGYLIVFTISIVLLILLFQKKAPSFFQTIVILFLAIGWQVYIYTFVYFASKFRLVSWLLFILLAITMSYEYIESYKHFLFVFIAIMMILSAYSVNSWSISEFKKNYTYSQSKEIADAISELPTDAVVFISSSEYCSPVVAQVSVDRNIYNPFNRKIASYVDRNPEKSEGMTYEEFIRTVEEMFPGIADCYVIVNSGELVHDYGIEYYGVRIEGLCENVKEGYTCFEKIYENTAEIVLQDSFYLLKINLN
ncbi:hypothetical protein [Butyrivibrio sp. AE2015]|uniref:hypothetical protein n=1 Tax=Butyrivibrio sp. AE2015 TaxID=1280663 RepID=UPI0003B45AD1|nr:hypothetical protein [Butyrivibrio sp. AE2015]